MTVWLGTDARAERVGADAPLDLCSASRRARPLRSVGSQWRGKSLFLQILAGIERADIRRDTAQRQSDVGLSARERARHIGYVRSSFNRIGVHRVRSGVAWRGGARRRVDNPALSWQSRRRPWPAARPAMVSLSAANGRGFCSRPSPRPVRRGFLADEPAASLDAKYRIEVCKALATVRRTCHRRHARSRPALHRSIASS